MKKLCNIIVLKRILVKALLSVLILLILTGYTYGVRIKDIAKIKGVRQNQLVGYGLVVGLNGTGDDDDLDFMIQSMAAMLEKMGVTVKAEDIESENVAAVIVTAELPPFARAGSRIDVIVSSIGDAENLQGGTLLITPLKAVNGQTYAVAQGPVSTGGFEASGTAGGGVQKNYPTVGRVPNGAFIEKEISFDFNQKKTLTFVLQHPDFTTASRMAQAINRALNKKVAPNSRCGHHSCQRPCALSWKYRCAGDVNRKSRRDPRYCLQNRHQRTHGYGHYG